MDGSRIGRGLRAIRIRANSTQKEIAGSAEVPRAVIASVERGDLARVRVGQLQAIAVALQADLDIVLRWNGTELDRLLNAGHSAMHELVVGTLTAAGWEVVPERSFSIWGERGVIDIVAWLAPSRTLLIVELKTEIVDVQRLIGTVDRYRRLAPQMVRDLGWEPVTVGAWVAVAESPTNRRRLGEHAGVLRAAFPSDGRTVAAGCDARPAPSWHCPSYQMPAWRTVRQLGRRGDACGRRPERSRGPPGLAEPIK
jgi:transcriptional regulator with XRE-family HTH domain